MGKLKEQLTLIKTDHSSIRGVQKLIR